MPLVLSSGERSGRGLDEELHALACRSCALLDSSRELLDLVTLEDTGSHGALLSARYPLLIPSVRSNTALRRRISIAAASECLRRRPRLLSSARRHNGCRQTRRARSALLQGRRRTSRRRAVENEVPSH